MFASISAAIAPSEMIASGENHQSLLVEVIIFGSQLG
jgi:hypothetical protein